MSVSCIKKALTAMGDNIIITDVQKKLTKLIDDEFSQYLVLFRANGTALFQYMVLNNELPDEVFAGIVQHTARRILGAAESKGL